MTRVFLNCRYGFFYIVSRLLKYEGTSHSQVTLETAGFFSQVVKLLVRPQMEDGSLVSCREDISSLFPAQMLSAKQQVGYFEKGLRLM